jgi:hypothetical protein
MIPVGFNPIIIRGTTMKFRVNGMLSGVVCVLLLGASAMAQHRELVAAEWGNPGHKVDVTARVRTFIHDGILQLEVTRFNLGIDPAPHENKVLIIRMRERDGDVKEYSYPERSMARLELHPEERREEHQQQEADERHDQDNDRHDNDHRDNDRHDNDRRDNDRRDQAYNDRRDQDDEHHERGLRIVRAVYGAEGQFADVTEALRSQIEDGRLFLYVDNDSMGIDPAPGIHKRLRVEYFQDGHRRNQVVEEKMDLRLP